MRCFREDTIIIIISILFSLCLYDYRRPSRSLPALFPPKCGPHYSPPPHAPRVTVSQAPAQLCVVMCIYVYILPQRGPTKPACGWAKLAGLWGVWWRAVCVSSTRPPSLPSSCCSSSGGSSVLLFVVVCPSSSCMSSLQLAAGCCR